MRRIDWSSVPDQQEFERPVPGGYIAVICSVDDNEEREYLEIRWDFAEGPFKGANRSTFERLGWWPNRLFRSYKESALGMFKAFKTALEESNPGYAFDEADLRGLARKRVGVVLGEEEYRKSDGNIGRRLYVAQTRSVQAIEDGDYKVPPPKTLAPAPSAGWGAPPPPPAYNSSWTQQSEEDGELPF